MVDLEPHVTEALREHKAGARWDEPGDFVFHGRFRGQPRERNAVRTKVLYPAIDRANELLAAEGHALIVKGRHGMTFHGTRRTYISLVFAQGADPAYVAAQVGHTDARMTLIVYNQHKARRSAANAQLGADLLGDDTVPVQARIGTAVA